MNKIKKLFPALFAVLFFSSCQDVKDPIHIIGEIENVDRREMTITYMFMDDTLLSSSLNSDTLLPAPFREEITILVGMGDKTYEFEKIPARYLNDKGMLSISRKVYYEDLFPTEWEELKERNIDYITLRFVVDKAKRFAIVVNANNGQEIGRYFEKLY